MGRPDSEPSRSESGKEEPGTPEEQGMPEEPGSPEPRNEGYPLPDAVPCPFCGEQETEVHSPFGGVMSVAQYYCRRCRTVFEWIK